MAKLEKIILFTVFVISSLVLLAIILPSIGVFTKRKLQSEQEWWKRYPIYVIYPRAFFDMDGDIRGLKGDIDDIIAKLPYLEWLGVKAIWLLPFYQSPLRDAGYDITDMRKTVAPMDHFRRLIQIIKEKDMYLIISLVPSYTSTEHIWFQRSRKSIGTRTSDFYIWSTIPWTLIQQEGEYQKPATWIFESSRQQHYLSYGVNPALNYKNEQVHSLMVQIIRFWLEKGIDGVVFDDFYDVQKTIVTDFLTYDGEYQKIDFDYNLVLKAWHDEVKSFAQKSKKPILSAIKPAYSITNLQELSKIDSIANMDIVINTDLQYVSKSTKMASYIREMVQKWSENPAEIQPNWLITDLHVPRATSRMGNIAYAGVLNMLITLLPGTPLIFYGDELGLEDMVIQWQNLTLHDVEPMPWNSDINPKINIRSQMADPESQLNTFKRLLQLHQEITVEENAQNLTLLNARNEAIVAFVRHGISKDFLVILNLGTSGFRTIIDLSSELELTEAEVYFRCGPNANSDFVIGAQVLLNSLQMRNGQGLILVIPSAKNKSKTKGQTIT